MPRSSTAPTRCPTAMCSEHTHGNGARRATNRAWSRAPRRAGEGTSLAKPFRGARPPTLATRDARLLLSEPGLLVQSSPSPPSWLWSLVRQVRTFLRGGSGAASVGVDGMPAGFRSHGVHSSGLEAKMRSRTQVRSASHSTRCTCRSLKSVTKPSILG